MLAFSKVPVKTACFTLTHFRHRYIPLTNSGPTGWNLYLLGYLVTTEERICSRIISYRSPA